jgi:hypothetical protein
MALVGTIARWALLLAAIVAVVIFAIWTAARPTQPDAFYNPPAEKPGDPGALLRSEPYTKQLPPGARGWRILYATRRGDTPTIASAIVVTSTQTTPAPRPVIAWAHGTTGIVPGCAPSVSVFAGVPALDRVIAENWVYIATDYPGLGTPGGHAIWSAKMRARGARRDPRSAADRRARSTTAPWCGAIRRAATPAVDRRPRRRLCAGRQHRRHRGAGAGERPPGAVQRAASTPFGKIVSSYLIKAYATAYPDVGLPAYVSARTRPFVSDIASRCAGGWPTLLSVAETKLLPSAGIFARDPGQARSANGCGKHAGDGDHGARSHRAGHGRRPCAACPAGALCRGALRGRPADRLSHLSRRDHVSLVTDHPASMPI